jgi:hypothetical protein
MQRKLSAFIEWIKPTTRWQRFVLIITISAYVFSIISLAMTLVALSSSPFFWETVPSTREDFSTFGLFWGSIVILGLNFLGVFVFPFVLWVTQKYSYEIENGKGFYLDFGHFGLLALIEALAFSNFSKSFLGMCNDLIVLSRNYGPLTTGQGTSFFGSPISFEFIDQLRIIVLCITFLGSFLFRTISRYKLEKDFNKK